MYRRAARRGLKGALAALLLLPVFAAVAAVPVHTIQADLKPLIRAAVDSPVQFAVLVPHTASTATAGTWTTAAGRATWTYAIRVPTAVSLSFHATAVVLPPSATLVVRGARTTVSYKASDLHRGELWSRIQPGEALQFELTVAAADRGKVALSFVSVQAGYRAVGPGVQDHPYYRALKAQEAAATGNAACVTNYECEVTAANTPPAAATLALVVGNEWICTGVLINDVPQDNTPYVLTARHCETGKLGGGDPGAAAMVTAYWDATSACGDTLGSIYDPNIPTQTGAQTIVEQQDAWLILLDASPVVSDAQLAGFDASGGIVQGGYTVHHAEGRNKQYTAWFGAAAAVQQTGVLGTTYLSDFWETVNSVGNTAGGASGSGLFDQNNHLVGSLSLGPTTNDPSGYGMCPVANPAPPNGTNGAAYFTALAAVWASVADSTSTTGAVTIQSVLDPGNTGTLVVPSAQVAAIVLDASPDGQSVQLSWNVTGAVQCAASGGVAGDGWTGNLAAAGTQVISESAGGTINYVLTCTYSGGRTAHTSVTIIWLGPTPVVQFNGPTAVWTTTPATLTWNSNVAPCAITGGGLSLTNLPATGSTTTTQANASDVVYTLTCGPAAQATNAFVTVSYVTPSLVLVANGTDRLIGQTFFLQWTTNANSCVPSGGAPNDGWDNNAFNGFYAQNQEPFYLVVTTPGTYTYTLTCSSGTLREQQSVTVTFENNPPYVTDSLSSSTVTFSASPADYVTLSWISNLSSCGLNSTPDVPVSYGGNAGFPQGELTVTPTQSGTFALSVYCAPVNSNTATVTATALTLTVLPPPPPVVTISFNPATIIAGQSYQASWNATNANACTLTGQWGGSVQQVAPVGSQTLIAPAAGQYTFGATCTSIDTNTAGASGQSTLAVLPFEATLTASATSVTSGSSFTLSWTSQGASTCSGSGGGANGAAWSGPLATSGTQIQSTSQIGSFTYTLSCSGAGESTAPQQVTVVVSPASTAGSGKSGGGGGFGWLELATLLALQRARRRLRKPMR